MENKMRYQIYKSINLSLNIILCGILSIVSLMINLSMYDNELNIVQSNIAVILSQIIVYGVPLLIFSTVNDHLDKKHLNKSNVFDTNKKIFMKSMRETINIKSVLLIIAISILTILSMYLFRNLFYNLNYFIFGNMPEAMFHNHEQASILNVPIQYIIIILISIVLVTSIIEEMFYRYMLIKKNEHIPVLLTIILSIICFSLAHNEMHQVILVIMLSVIVGITLMKTKSILYPILIHGIANIFSLFNFDPSEYLFYYVYPIIYDEPSVALQNTIFSSVMVIACIILSVYLIAKLPVCSVEANENKDYTSTAAAKIFAFLIYLAGCGIFCFFMLSKIFIISSL